MVVATATEKITETSQTNQPKYKNMRKVNFVINLAIFRTAFN